MKSRVSQIWSLRPWCCVAYPAKLHQAPPGFLFLTLEFNVDLQVFIYFWTIKTDDIEHHFQHAYGVRLEEIKVSKASSIIIRRFSGVVVLLQAWKFCLKSDKMVFILMHKYLGNLVFSVNHFDITAILRLKVLP